MENLTKLMQAHVANLLSASVARNMGPSGTVAAARAFLRELVLQDFSNPKNFPRTLGAATSQLKSALPRGARHWGSARKFLNLFLRDATYNYHLREAFNLHRIAFALELPLDSFSAKGLIESAAGTRLPKWPGVIHLKPAESIEYQMLPRNSPRA